MFEFLPPEVRLLGVPRLSDAERKKIIHDFDGFRRALPNPLEPYVLSTYGLDLRSVYGGAPIKNPFGKASGQLSLALHQVEKDAEAGLGFVVLKTVIAEDRAGVQTMREWAIPETRMLVERIRGRSGQEGWTVTWKGRGWYDTFGAYQSLFHSALEAGRRAGMLVVPSVKYHLPAPQEDSWKEDEYDFTTAALVETWRGHFAAAPMPLEKDFSPTLAGSGRASQKVKILEWLRRVPGLIHRAASRKVRVGLKIFNTLFEDDFQLEMLEAIHGAPGGEDRADFFVYANRLFDPARQFEGKVGAAYGGPDLSDRNLAVLERLLDEPSEAENRRNLLPLSATGNICSGRIAAEHLLRGASSFQMHTLFQLPDGEFAMKAGSKIEKALHLLLFHPEQGFIAWMLDCRRRFGWKGEASIEDRASWCRANWSRVIDSRCG